MSGWAAPMHTRLGETHPTLLVLLARPFFFDIKRRISGARLGGRVICRCISEWSQARKMYRPGIREARGVEFDVQLVVPYAVPGSDSQRPCQSSPTGPVYSEVFLGQAQRTAIGSSESERSFHRITPSLARVRAALNRLEAEDVLSLLVSVLCFPCQCQ